MAVQDEAVNWVGVGSRRFVDLVQGPESYFTSHENHLKSFRQGSRASVLQFKKSTMYNGWRWTGGRKKWMR